MAIPPLQDSILETTTTLYHLGLVGLIGSNLPYSVFPISHLVNARGPLGDFGGSLGKASRKKMLFFWNFFQMRGAGGPCLNFLAPFHKCVLNVA